MSSLSEIAITVDGVSKDFKFTSTRSNTLKSVFTSLFKESAKDKKIQHALKDISFEVRRGEFFGIVGRNGSGKSTLLKMLAGIYQPNKGHLHVQGKVVPFIELGVGFNPELTGRENVYLNGALLNFSQKEIDAFYDEVVEFAELGQFMDKKLKNYSSGMQVRLAFSMAIRAKADILIIDEVLAVGDADFQRKCFNYFKQLKHSDTTVVFVTHDMTAVRQFCDRAMLINDGVIAEEGDVETVALSYSSLFTDESDARIGVGSDHVPKDLRNVKVAVADNIKISGEIVPEAKLEEPILGFAIKDATGLSVMGDNTKMSGRNLGTLTKGKVKGFSWSFDNVLSDGEYTVDIALLEEDGTTVIDWWNEALRFTVKKQVVSPFPVSPKISLTMRDKS